MARRWKGMAWGLVALLCLALRIAPAAAATSVTWQANDATQADTGLRLGITTTFGGSTTNTVRSSSGANRRILVKFNNVSTIPTDAAIKAANLSLVQTVAGVGPRTYGAYRITSDWGEGTGAGTACTTAPGAVWGSAITAGSSGRNLTTCTLPWTTAIGGDCTVTGCGSGFTATATIANGSAIGTIDTWNIKADVQAYVLGTATNYGTLIKDNTESAATAVTNTFGMKENAIANRPSLTVTYLRQVTNLTASASSGQVVLNWTIPTPGTDYNGTLVVRKAASDFTSNFSSDPVDGISYVAGNTIGTDVVPVVANLTGSQTSYTDSTATNGTTYFYRVYARDSSANYSVNTVASSTAPVYPKVSATPADGSVTGNPNWSYATGATTLAPPGLTDGGVVVTGSNDSKLHGMSAVTGTRSFTPFATGNAIQSRPPVIPSSLLISLGVTPAFVTSQDGSAYAVNTATGAQVWNRASLGTALQGGAAVWLQTIKAVTFSGGVTDDIVFVTTRNTGDTTTNKVYALNVATGVIVWTFNPLNMDGIASTPYIDYASNTIWVSSLSKGGTQASLWKLNAVSGTLATSFSSLGGDITSSPVASLDGNVSLAPSFIYVGTDAGDLKAIKVSDNSVISCGTTCTSPGAGAIKGFPLSFSFSTPSVGTPDTIVFSRNATVHSVSFNGASFGTNWTTTNFPSATVTSVSAPIDNFNSTKIYVGASDGKVHALGLSTGVDAAQVSIVGTPTPIVGDPSFDITLDRIYVGTNDVHIYSFTSF